MLSALNANGAQIQPLEVKDFSGGITDNYIAGPSNKYQKADNFFISDDDKLATRPALIVDDTSHARVASNDIIQKLFDSEAQLFQISGAKLYYNSSGFTTVSGPTANDFFTAGSTSSKVSITKWNKHAFATNDAWAPVMKLFKDGSTWKAHQLGLPDIASDPTITGTGVGKTFLYAFHYSYQYTSGGVTFEEVGPVLYHATTVANNNDPATTNISITNIPVLANSTTNNYDTSTALKVNIYRTADGGSVFYYVGQVNNGTTSYTDNTSDSTIQTNNVLLYTTGGIPDHEKPPTCKHIHTVNDVLYCGNIKEGGVQYPNLLRLSNRFQPWSMPGSFEVEFDDEIMGISSVNIYPIVFTKSQVYRLHGFYFPDGSGGVTKNRISDTVGCINADSIVQTEKGIFWAGLQGFYFTDGSTVMRISEDINVTYKSLVENSTQQGNIKGAYDAVNQRIKWTVQVDDVATVADTIYVAHVRKGIKPDTPFTTWSGNTLVSTNFKPTSIHFYNNVIYIGDARGYLLKYDYDQYSDAYIDTTTAATAWRTLTIIYDHRSCAFDFGSSAIRKWVPWIVVNADNSSSVSLQVSGNNDNSGYFRELAEIQYYSNIDWGNYAILWGDASLRWNYSPIISTKRRFPAGGLRCSYKQVKFTNSYTLITDSTTVGSNATIDGAANTATLVDNTKTFPSDVLDYYLQVADDSYATDYQITTRNSDTQLTVSDINNVLPSGVQAYKIKGYRRGEVLKIHSYIVDYSFTSQTQEPYRA